MSSLGSYRRSRSYLFCRRWRRRNPSRHSLSRSSSCLRSSSCSASWPSDCFALKSIQRHSVRLDLDSVRVAGPMASNPLIDLPPEIASRRHQMFPVLTEPEIARISRFGTVQHYPRGTRLFAAGEPGPGMFVVLKGAIVVSQRDGLGHVVPVVRHEPGGFSAEVGQLSGGYSLVDGYAEEDVDALLVPPAQLRALIIAEADLGEGIVRALILRRVGLIESGASGPVLIGEPESPELLRLQTFLRRNGHPHQVLDAADADAAAFLEQYGAAVSEVLVV